MNRGALLNFLANEARLYRKEALASVKRSGHMNNLSKKDLKRLEEDPESTQRIIDALLVDFVNRIGVGQGLDFGLHTKDLES